MAEPAKYIVTTEFDGPTAPKEFSGYSERAALKHADLERSLAGVTRVTVDKLTRRRLKTLTPKKARPS